MLTKKQQAVALDLATGVTQRAAAQKYGLHYMTLTGWKRREDFLAEIERLRAAFRNIAAGRKV